jgi:hypothetical protein
MTIQQLQNNLVIEVLKRLDALQWLFQLHITSLTFLIQSAIIWVHSLLPILSSVNLIIIIQQQI